MDLQTWKTLTVEKISDALRVQGTTESKLYESDKLKVLDSLVNEALKMRSAIAENRYKKWENQFKTRFTSRDAAKVGLKAIVQFHEGNLHNKYPSNRLIAFDKDGTLTKTYSGNTFATTPEDQQLIYKEKDFSDLGIIAIATNQKGIMLEHKTKDFLDHEIFYLRRKLNFYFEYCVACPDNGDNLLTFSPDRLCIATGIDSRIDNDYKMTASLLYNPSSEASKFGINPKLKGTFRKPHGGMLLAIVDIHRFDREGARREFSSRPCVAREIGTARPSPELDERIFVGDRDSDRLAAEDAGFIFVDSTDWAEADD